MSDTKFIIQALLLASPHPLEIKKLVELTSLPSTEIQAGLQALSADFQEHELLRLTQTASGWSLKIQEKYIPWVQKLYEQKPQRLSKALLETLALVAYRQPITRTEIENIRGVAVNAQIIRQLMDQDWVKVVGHRDLPGRPELLATTKRFLDDFGLLSLKYLPSLDPEESL